MTTAPAAASTDEQASSPVADPAPLTRVVVFVGDGTEMDFVLPAKVQVMVIVEDLLDSVNQKLKRRRQPQLEERAHVSALPGRYAAAGRHAHP